MKRIYTGILILSLLTTFTWWRCSKSDDEGGGGNTSTNPIEWTALETKSIGPSSPVIQYNDITLTFQADQLSQNYEVRLYKGSEGSSFYGDASGDVLGIEFLSSPDRNLEVQIAVRSDNPTDESIYLGLKDLSQSDGLVNQTVRPITTSLAGSETLSATVSLPLDDIQSIESGASFLSRRSEDGTIFGIFGGKKPIRDSSTHFTLEKPASNSANLTTYLGYLEEAYTKLKNLGFPMDSLSAAKNGRISCFIGNTGQNNQGESNLGMYYMISNHVYITDDQSALSGAGTGDVKATLGHEFFHYVQYNWFISRISLSNSYSWLAEASAVWFEYQMDSPTRYVDVAITNCNFIKDGLEGKTSANIDNHGYGASYFMKHLTRSRGNQVMAQIWYIVKGQIFGKRVSALAIDDCMENYDTGYGIKSSADHEMSEFVNAYLDSVLNGIGSVSFGNLYPDENKFFIKDTLTKTFTSTKVYPDLGTHIYHCWIPSKVKDQFKTEDTLDFEINFSDKTSFFQCLVFNVKTGKLLENQLASKAPILIKDFKTNDELAVAVYYSNHALYYDSQRSNTVQFTVTKRVKNPYSSVRVQIALPREYDEVVDDPYTTVYPSSDLIYPVTISKLTWQGQYFQGVLDSAYIEYGDSVYLNASISGKFNSDFSRIEEATVSRTHTSVYNGSTWSSRTISSKSARIINVPYAYQLFGYVYSLSGITNVRNSISDIFDEYTEQQKNTGEDWRTIGKWVVKPIAWDKTDSDYYITLTFN